MISLEHKKYLVNGIENNDPETVNFLKSDFAKLYSSECVKKIIKVFQLSEMEGLRLLPFEEETLKQFCVEMSFLQEDINKRDGAIYFITNKLIEIEPKPYWVFWYKVSDFKKWETNYKSKPFRAKKEAIRAAFALPKQTQEQASSFAGAKLLNRSDEDVVKLVRLAFKNRRSELWAEEDETFRQEFHYKYKDYSNYNENNQNKTRNQKAWEMYGMCVYRADMGGWMQFSDILDKQLKDEFMMITKVYCEEAYKESENNVKGRMTREIDDLLGMFRNSIKVINDLLIASARND